MSGPKLSNVKTPEIGNEVYLDFGDSFFAKPEMVAIVEDISDDGLFVAGEWISWEEIVDIQVLG